MVGGPIVVRHRSFGPAHRTLAPKVRSARPGFAAPARPGLRLGRVESLVRATVVSVPPDREPGASRREPRSARRLSAANRGRPPRFATETSIDHRDFQPQTAVGRPKLRSITAISVANRGLPTKATSSADAQRVAMSKSKASKAVSEAEISAQDRALLNAFLNAKVEKRPTPLKQPGKRWPRVTSP